jgi:hypothetical protein
VISYRHHVVSLVAVFLALAVGVTLGGGPLSELGRDSEPAAKASAQQQDSGRAAAYADEFAKASAKKLYADRLRNHAVSVVTLPGADRKVVSALNGQVEAAGGSVAGVYDVQSPLVDASEKSLVDTLGSQLMTQLGSAVSADASTYDRLGQLLGLAVGATDLSPEDALSIRQSLAGAELLNSPGEADRTALVLVVLGDHVDDAILSGLMSGLAAKATGVVVAGNAESGTTGDLEALRAQPATEKVATVDGTDSALGQVTAVLALARSLTEQGGSYGAAGSDGTVPLG